MVADTGIFIEHLRAKDKLSTTLYKTSENQDRYTITRYVQLCDALDQRKRDELSQRIMEEYA